MRRINSVIALALAAGSAAGQYSITVDPAQPDGARVERMGWDLKGFQNFSDTLAKAQDLFGSGGANLIRIPIFAPAHNENGSLNGASGFLDDYDQMFASLFWAKTVVPDLEIFVSIKLDGADTFPAWVESDVNGSIFGNQVKRPDPEKYSKLIADYLRLLRGRGLSVGMDYTPQWIGPNNETQNALTADRHIDTVRMLRQRVDDLIMSGGLEPAYADWQVVSPDAFGLGGGNDFMDDIVSLNGLDTVDIAGNHYYYSQNDDAADWINLGSTAMAPMWFTEVHLSPNFNQSEDPMVRARRGLGTLFDANRAGVDTFVWWGNAGANNVQGFTQRQINDMLLGAQPLATTPSWPVKNAFLNSRIQIAYREGSRVSLFFANPGSGRQTDVDVQLVSGRISGGISTNVWGSTDNALDPGEITSPTATVDADGGGFTFNMPTNTLGIFTFSLASPVPLFTDNFDSGSSLNSNLPQRQSDGAVTSTYTDTSNAEGFTSVALSGGSLVLGAADLTSNGTDSEASATLDADFGPDFAQTAWSVMLNAQLDTTAGAPAVPSGLVFETDVIAADGSTIASVEVDYEGTVSVITPGGDAPVIATGFDPVAGSLPIRLELDETSGAPVLDVLVDGTAVAVGRQTAPADAGRVVRLTSRVADVAVGSNLLASVDSLRVSGIVETEIDGITDSTDIFDLIEFLRRLDAGDPAADVTDDGLFNASDVQAFSIDLEAAAIPR